MPLPSMMAHNRLPMIGRSSCRYASLLKRGVVGPATRPRPRRSTEAVESNAAWALSTTKVVERIFTVSNGQASEFVSCFTERLPTSAQLDGMLTSSTIAATVNEAVTLEMGCARLELRTMLEQHQSESRSEQQGLRSALDKHQQEMRSEQQGLRSALDKHQQEMRSEQQEMRSEQQVMRSEQQGLRSALDKHQQEMRSDLQSQRLEREIHQVEMRSELRDMRSALEKQQLETRSALEKQQLETRSASEKQQLETRSASEKQHLEVRLAFALITIGLLVFLGPSSVGATFMAVFMKVMSGFRA